jgi:hypothetical protein
MARCTIDDETYARLKVFIERFGNVSPQTANFWVNLVCQVGLAALENNKADFGKIMAGRDPKEWFYENNVTLLPVPAKPQIPVTDTEEPSQAAQSEEGKRRKRRSNYNPDEYRTLMQNLE